MSERTQVIPPAKPQRGMVIRTLLPRLPERGKIKIGGLSPQKRQSQGGREWQPPVKYDHFVITTMRRGADGNFERDQEMHRRFGEKPTQIPVRLLYDDPTLNFPTRLACYKGRSLWCSGDGQKALRLNDQRQRVEVACPCPLSDPTIERKANELRCKMNGSLAVLIEGASGLGGVWRFRTTSFNSITGLLSTMAFLRQVTGGPLANLPLLLKIQPQQAANPVTGETVEIFVVGLEFDGTVEDLQDYGHRVALHRAQTHLSIEHIEEEARRNLLLAAPVDAPLPGDDDSTVDEFYPEQVDARAAEAERPKREDYVADTGTVSGAASGAAAGVSGAATTTETPERQSQDSTAAQPQKGDPPTDLADPKPEKAARASRSTSKPASSAPLSSPAADEEAGEQPSATQASAAPAQSAAAPQATEVAVEAEAQSEVWSFVDTVGEVHEHQSLGDAVANVAEMMRTAPDRRTLEAIQENAREIINAASEAEYATIRAAAQEALQRIKVSAAPSPATEADVLHEELLAMATVKELHVKWLKLDGSDRARLKVNFAAYEEAARKRETAK